MNAIEQTIEQVTIRVLPDGRVSRKDAAAYLGHTEKTLRQWAVDRKHLTVIKVCGRCFYAFDELQRRGRGETA